MLITKTNPSGLNWYVQQLQTALHTTLVGASGWNLADSAAYRAYGLCYRNKTADGYVAENYEGSDQYREVYFDDTLTAISFFGLSGPITQNGAGSEADVHLVFFADLNKLALKDSTGATISHRADEELRNSVLNLIGKSRLGFVYQSTELWLENVLKEYPGSRRDERLKYVDMHPGHCFRINLKLFFNQKKIC